VLLNGAGATTLMELFIVYRRVCQVCTQKGIEVARGRVGEFLTVQEMAGFQMHVARVNDNLISLWDAPCDAPYFVVR
jgi:dihydroxyacetone kinase-like protein